MAKSDKYREMTSQILKEVGGISNVLSVTHCMTRLRFNLKDSSIPDDDKVKKITGVLGVARSGGQYQIIIGQTVPDVYQAVLDAGNGALVGGAPIDENLDENPKEKLTFKRVFNIVLNKVAGSLTPTIPILISAALFKMLAAVCGPTMLNITPASSDLYKVFTFVGDAGFYFFPIFLGYTSAKQFHTSKMLGMFLGAIMLDLNLVKIITAGRPFTVYGIPMTLVNYGSTLVPILLSVWVMSYIYKFFDKHMPAALRTMMTPFLTIAIMVPVTLCVLGPLGGFIGDGICNGLLSFGKMGGIWAIIAIAIIGAVWELLVLTGMHLVIISAMTLIFTQGGHDNFATLGGVAASMACAGMALGCALKIKGKQNKALAWGYFISNLIGGVTEPALYGLAIRYKRPFIGMMIGGFAGALYAGIVHETAYVLVPVANFLALSTYVGGSVTNIINGVISGAIALVVAAVATYLLGFNGQDVEDAK
ncbi:PTS system beta-glucosides-specific IIC component [Lactobacillus colini]|uniref:PTS system beta-glucosides-specific IIC component n=1 Tax=Lactobacillus colini TaxID=1819254 RepID=A0ABS4MF37_9LACO|nr:PTS transporter subunit EIIC [Lactobacillus colini]MBP2058228.1 PTS system beta-glucosides-specific IIC component [Lactobacillus colini]